MFVKYTPKIKHIKVIPLLPDKKSGEGYTFDNDTVTLRPGTNEISDKEWDAIQPHIKDLIGKEIVAIDTPAKSKSGKGKKAKSLKDIPVKTARLIIEGCQDPNTLKKWFNQELPDELLLVVSKRMRKLKIEPEDLKGDDVNLDELKGSSTPEPEEETETEPETETKTDTADDDEGGDETEEETEDEEELTEDDDDSEIPDFDGSKGDKTE